MNSLSSLNVLRSVALVTALVSAPCWGARSLTLEQAIEAALLDSAEVDRALQQLSELNALLQSERSPFVPALQVNSDYRFGSDPALSPFADYYYPHDVVQAHRGTLSVHLTGRATWGMEYDVQAGWTHTQSDQRGLPLSPSFQLPIQLSVSQPLLRDFGPINERLLHEAAVRRDRAEIELNRLRQDLAFRVAQAYVNLQAAERLVQSREESRQLAQSLAELTAKLIEGGRLPATALHADKVTISIREQDLLQAQLARERAEASLARLLGHPGERLAPAEPLNPLAQQPTSAGDLGARAEANNPLVRLMTRELQLNELNLTYRVNLAKPDLRLTANAGLSGYSGILQCEDGFFLDGVSPCNVPLYYAGGPDQTVRNLLTGRYGFVGVGLVFSLPLDRGPLMAGVESAQVALSAHKRQLEHHRALAREEAEESAQLVERWVRIHQETQRNVELAKASLETAKDAYSLGRTTVLEVVRAEELIAQSRDREVGAAQALMVERIRLRFLLGEMVPLGQ